MGPISREPHQALQLVYVEAEDWCEATTERSQPWLSLPELWTLICDGALSNFPAQVVGSSGLVQLPQTVLH